MATQQQVNKTQHQQHKCADNCIEATKSKSSSSQYLRLGLRLAFPIALDALPSSLCGAYHRRMRSWSVAFLATWLVVLVLDTLGVGRWLVVGRFVLVVASLLRT